jgi:hypothetical protein
LSTGLKANVDGSAAIQVGGVDAITLTSAGAASFVTSPMTIQGGSAAAPSLTFSGDTNTGIFSPAADTVAIGTGGTEALRVNSSQSLLLNTTSAPAASAKMKIATSARTGAFFDLTATGGENWIIDSTNTTGSTDVLGIYANGATGLYLQDTGNVGIGTSSPGALFHANGTIRYTNRPAAGTITAIGYDANGDLKNSSSSLRYKYDIEDYGKGLAEVMQLRPVSFKFNGEERQNIGYIAEEVDALGLTEVMLYDEEQQPDGVLYANMVALLTKAIQEQQQMIETLQAEVALLKGAA